MSSVASSESNPALTARCVNMLVAPLCVTSGWMLFPNRDSRGIKAAANPAFNFILHCTDSVARISQVSQSAALALLPQLTFQGSTLETLMHVADGTNPYYIGLLYDMADMLDSLDITHCKLSNYFLNETVFCACGDTPFASLLHEDQKGCKGSGCGALGLYPCLIHRISRL